MTRRLFHHLNEPRERMRTSHVWNMSLLIGGILAITGAAAVAQAQGAVVTGTVVAAETGQPIPSVTVVVQGTSAGTQTNESGAFTLRPQTLTVNLVASRIGYVRQVVPLGGRSTVEIRMVRTTVSLSDVVVVGYGTQARSDITGSVASVSNERLQEKPNTSFAQAIEGAVPGVTVTTGTAGSEPNIDIQVRGRNSISASTAPLVVVDGIPYYGTLAELNQNDIASLEILKDASATAIYGTRGSNGVVLVTSKKGATGKPRLSYTGYTGTQRISNLPVLMNAQEFAAFKCVRTRATPATPCMNTLTATEQRGLAAGTDTDWARVGTRDGRQMQHDVAVSGGNDDTRYYLGGSMLDVQGVAMNDNFDRGTVRLNIDQKVKSWLSIGTSTQGSRTQRDGVPTDFTAAFFSNPLISPYDSAGNFLLVPWPEDPITNNPLENLRAIDSDVSKRVFSSNYIQLNVPRLTGLSYRLNAGFDVADRNSSRYYGRNTQTGLSVGGLSTVSNTRRNDWTLENVLRFARTFGRQNIDLTGVFSEQSFDLESNGLRGQGYPNDVLEDRSTLPLLAVPTISVVESRLLSQVGRLNYQFDNRYLLTLTARRDGYSGFGANNKYGVFPSLAAGWNISNEKFFPWEERVDALKLRVSYGRTGNQAIQPYQTLSQLDDRSYLNGETSAAGYIPLTLGNPNLRWESTLARNIGLDLSMLRERLTLTMDAYSSRTSDLLLRRSISPVHGINSILQNIGKTANKGFEMDVGAVPIDRGAFRWRTQLNFSVNRNEIVDLYGNATDDIASGWFIGQPIDVNYGYRFAGIWQVEDSISGRIASSAQPTARPGFVRVEDLNGDGKIDPTDRTFIGSLEPRYIAGFTNTFRLNRLTFSAFFNTVQGVTRSNALLGTNLVFTDVRRNAPSRVYWTPETPINTYPSNSNGSNPLGVPFYEDASFIRLKDLTLSYDLPVSAARRFGSETLRLYVNGRNLWTRTEWTGLDPELSNQRAIPLERVITGGLTVNF